MSGAGPQGRALSAPSRASVGTGSRLAPACAATDLELDDEAPAGAVTRVLTWVLLPFVAGFEVMTWTGRALTSRVVAAVAGVARLLRGLLGRAWISVRGAALAVARSIPRAARLLRRSLAHARTAIAHQRAAVRRELRRQRAALRRRLGRLTHGRATRPALEPTPSSAASLAIAGSRARVDRDGIVGGRGERIAVPAAEPLGEQ